MDAEYYYCDQAQKTHGPYSSLEIRELLRDGQLTPSSSIWRPGDTGWQELQRLSEYPQIQADAPACDHENTIIAKALKEDLPTPDETPQVVVAAPTVEDKEETKDEAAEEEEAKPTRTRHLQVVRKNLDALWKCQREAIIAEIRGEELGEIYQATRKQSKQIDEHIEEAALSYWRTSGLLRKWIRDFTWQDADFSRKLRGTNEFDKYTDLQQWIEEKQISELSACYCFKSGARYIYVGRATVLRDRFKQYEKSKYFLLTDLKVRVIVPKYKTQIGKMERLLILLHEPEENRNTGDTGKNPVDNCLNFIRSEVKELLTDF